MRRKIILFQDRPLVFLLSDVRRINLSVTVFFVCLLTITFLSQKQLSAGFGKKFFGNSRCHFIYDAEKSKSVAISLKK